MNPTALLLLWFAVLNFPLTATSNGFINTEDHLAGSITMNELSPRLSKTDHTLSVVQKKEKRSTRLERQLIRIEKYFQSRMEKKSLGNINDPIDKWFWFWGISWGIGILLSIFSAGAIVGTGIGLIWWLLFAIGSISLVVWLVKKYG